MNINEWMAKKEQLQACLVERRSNADLYLMKRVQAELADGPTAGDDPDTLALLRARYPASTWPGDMPETVAARLNPTGQS